MARRTCGRANTNTARHRLRDVLPRYIPTATFAAPGPSFIQLAYSSSGPVVTIAMESPTGPAAADRSAAISPSASIALLV